MGHLVLGRSERTERRATCRNEMYHSRGKEVVADLWDPLMGRTPSLTVNLELRVEEEANLERPREQRAKTVEHSVSAR